MNKQVVFVIGSKPEAVFPDVAPGYVYAANGSIARAQDFLQDAHVTGVVLNRFFAADDRERQSSTAKTLKGCQVNRLVISGGARRKSGIDAPGQRGLTCEQVVRLSRLRSVALKLRHASWGRLLRNLDFRPHPKEDGRLITRISRTRSLPALGISTGMLAVLLALKEHPKATIYVIGIGLDPTAGQFHDHTVSLRFHVEADRVMIDDLRGRVDSRQLVFTDPELSSYVATPR